VPEIARLDSAAADFDARLGALLDRAPEQDAQLMQAVAGIVADVRKRVAGDGDLARQPAKVVRELDGVLRDCRSTLVDARNVWDATAREYQIASEGPTAQAAKWTVNRTKDLLGMRTYQADMSATIDGMDDAIAKLLAYMNAPTESPKRYRIVRGGDSLARVAMQEYGNAELWRYIADAQSPRLISETISLT